MSIIDLKQIYLYDNNDYYKIMKYRTFDVGNVRFLIHTWQTFCVT